MGFIFPNTEYLKKQYFYVKSIVDSFKFHSIHLHLPIQTFNIQRDLLFYYNVRLLQLNNAKILKVLTNVHTHTHLYAKRDFNLKTSEVL